MIFCCQTKCCNFLFQGSDRTTTCPDCGKKNIRPATREERIAYFHQRTEALVRARHSG